MDIEFVIVILKLATALIPLLIILIKPLLGREDRQKPPKG